MIYGKLMKMLSITKRSKIWPYLGRPERIFLLIAGIFGFVFLFLTPPFQVTDEINHFYRAYQLTKVQIVGVKTELGVGGYIPENIGKTASDFTYLFGQKDKKIKVSTITKQFKIPLVRSRQVFASFPNTVLYSPIPYFPQMVGIQIGKMLNASPIVLMYLARIVNFSVWLFLIYCAIKTTPIFKWGFLMLGLMPMTMFLAASLSPDAFAISGCFLFIALVLNLAFGKQVIISRKQIILLGLFAIVLALTKQVYFLLPLTIFLIPKKKFGSKCDYVQTGVLVSVVSFAFMWMWMKKVEPLFVPIMYGVDPNGQIEWLKTHPWEYLEIIGTTLRQFHNILLQSFIGKLGWYDVDLPLWITWSYLLGMILVGFTMINQKIILGVKSKAYIGFIFLSLFLMVLTFMYIDWDAPGNFIIYGLQGRYFIPIAPLFFILFYSNRWRFSREKLNYMKLIIPSYCIVILITVVYYVVKRYYFV